jgi:hypothetical protein
MVWLFACEDDVEIQLENTKKRYNSMLTKSSLSSSSLLYCFSVTQPHRRLRRRFQISASPPPGVVHVVDVRIKIIVVQRNTVVTAFRLAFAIVGGVVTTCGVTSRNDREMRERAQARYVIASRNGAALRIQRNAK